MPRVRVRHEREGRPSPRHLSARQVERCPRRSQINPPICRLEPSGGDFACRRGGQCRNAVGLSAALQNSFDQRRRKRSEVLRHDCNVSRSIQPSAAVPNSRFGGIRLWRNDRQRIFRRRPFIIKPTQQHAMTPFSQRESCEQSGTCSGQRKHVVHPAQVFQTEQVIVFGKQRLRNNRSRLGRITSINA